MRGPFRDWKLAVAFLLCAAAIGVVAIVDHRDKQRRIDNAQVADYYCAHSETECGAPSWRTIEHHWQIRQYAYESAVGALVGLAAATFGYQVVRARRATTSSSRSER